MRMVSLVSILSTFLTSTKYRPYVLVSLSEKTFTGLDYCPLYDEYNMLAVSLQTRQMTTILFFTHECIKIVSYLYLWVVLLLY